jgi:hypothetical protein
VFSAKIPLAKYVSGKEEIMRLENSGFEIPGATPSTTFARKPGAFLNRAIATGQPLLILRKNKAICAVVPITCDEDVEQYLRACPLEKSEVFS